MTRLSSSLKCACSEVLQGLARLQSWTGKGLRYSGMMLPLKILVAVGHALRSSARLQGKFLSFEIDTRGTVVTCINRIGASVVSRETLDMRLSCGSKITSKIVRRRYYAMCRHAIKMARPGFQDDEVHSNRARNDHA